jgi:hypothetical protein
VTKSTKAADAAAVGEKLHVEKVGKGGLASVEFKPEERDGKTLFRGTFVTTTTTVTSLTDAFSGVVHSIKEGGRFGFILARYLSRPPAPAVSSSRFCCTTRHHMCPSFYLHSLASAIPTSHSLCSINDRRGSVYVNLEKKPEIKQGQASKRPIHLRVQCTRLLTFPLSFPQIVEFNVRMQGESKVQAIITKVTNLSCLQLKNQYFLAIFIASTVPTTSLLFRSSPKAAFATARSKKTSPTAHLLPPLTLQPPLPL